MQKNFEKMKWSPDAKKIFAKLKWSRDAEIFAKLKWSPAAKKKNVGNMPSL